MQREYRLDLERELPTMTWRRFLVLVRGLSPQSALVTAMDAKVRFGKRPDAVQTVSGAAAQRAFEAAFAPARTARG